MRSLGGSDDVRGLCGLPGQRTVSLRFRVERGLQMLEYECVVEDADVGRRETACGPRSLRASEEDGADSDRADAEEGTP